MSARSDYYAQRKDYRASVHAHAIALESAEFADGPQYSIERRRAASILRDAPRGYGRRIIDPLVVRRALRSNWLGIKADFLAGIAREIDVYDARADLTGESPTSLLKRSMKRDQCAKNAIPRDVAERYIADERFFTSRPLEVLAKRYASPALTDTEMDERRFPSNTRQREKRAEARKPLPLPRDFAPFEWSRAA